MPEAISEVGDLYDETDWGGHFFPSPEELGGDPESVAWEYGNCGCGVGYADWILGREPECA